MKGIFHSNPPKPKYSMTWNVDVVLDYIDRLGNSEDLSLPVITRKLSVLMALTTLLRVSEIASISRGSIRISDGRATFSLSKPRKAQRSGPLHSFTIKSFPDRPNVCPVSCLGFYLYKSDPVRNAASADSLFITTKGPFKAATGATLGRCIKDVLKDAGIDTLRFSAHSTRGASASRAAKIGIPVDSILETAHWSSQSTFTRFYHRETEQDFGEAILAGAVVYTLSVVYLFPYA